MNLFMLDICELSHIIRCIESGARREIFKRARNEGRGAFLVFVMCDKPCVGKIHRRCCPYSLSNWGSGK